MSKSFLSRRNFFKKSAAGLAGAGAVYTGIGKGHKSPDIFLPKFPNPDEYKIKKYRPLGKLGFKASDISLGTTGATDPSLTSFAFDCGINYVDTAYDYGRGNAEVDLGKILNTRKEKIWVTTKFSRQAWNSDNLEKSLMDSLDESLSRMKIEQIDTIMVWNGTPEKMEMEELHNMFEKAKKAGKVKPRNFGVATGYR